MVTLARPQHRALLPARPQLKPLYSRGLVGRTTQRSAHWPMPHQSMLPKSLQPHRQVLRRLMRTGNVQAKASRSRRLVALSPHHRSPPRLACRRDGKLQTKGGAAFPTLQPKGVAEKGGHVEARRPDEAPAMHRRRPPMPCRPARATLRHRLTPTSRCYPPCPPRSSSARQRTSPLRTKSFERNSRNSTPRTSGSDSASPSSRRSSELSKLTLTPS